MAVKRKRETAVVSRSDKAETDEARSEDAAGDNAHDIFRRYFESQFKPLDLPSVKTAQTTESEASESEQEGQGDEKESGSEWDGISDAEGIDTQVEVVEYTNSQGTASTTIDKKARKAFMNAKPPDLLKLLTTKKSTSKKEEESSDDDAMDLKNDLALQRLLKESHLLESANDLDPTGKNRHKALDLRVQSLGAKTSLFMQEKMPMSHRKGIQGKAASKEEKRRREAKENGIILEKPTFKSKSSGKKRERGIGGPSIGKFAGGTLKLSKGDITSIQGKSMSSKGKKPRR